MKPAQPDQLSRAERAALRRLREQVRQEKRERSKPVQIQKEQKANT